MSSICHVEDCVRPGNIRLDFPPDHAERSIRHNHATLICEYHARMAVELFSEMGIVQPINTRPARKVLLDRTGRVQHYPAGKARDNTEYS